MAVEVNPPFRLVSITPKDVGDVWPLVEPLISRVLQRGRGEAETADILANLLAGTMDLWVVVPGPILVVVTETMAYPRMKTLGIRLCAGDDGNRDDWLPYLKDIEAHAKDDGCSAVEIIGRRGWKRLLPDYHETHVVLRKDL